MSTGTDAAKREAIDTHSRQSGEFAEAYERLRADPYRDCFAYSRHRLAAALARELPARGDGLRLLDVGCGTGHHLADWRERGFDASGVDGSPEMLEQARQRNPAADLRLSDVDRLPYPDGQFDVAVSIEVLRYLPRPGPCLAEMRRVLKPGGLCLVTAAPLLNANGYWLVNRLATLAPLAGLVRLKQYFTTGPGLRRRLRAAGFEAVAVKGVYTGPINWVERLAPGALRGVLRAWEPLDARLADAGPLRELANMFLARGLARRP